MKIRLGVLLFLNGINSNIQDNEPIGIDTKGDEVCAKFTDYWIGSNNIHRS
ncbi:MAG TPA: hypothetical protein VH500_00425 [Nitrososphaeraceae archaeon]|jgi:hypothetical protein